MNFDDTPEEAELLEQDREGEVGRLDGQQFVRALGAVGQALAEQARTFLKF